MVEVAVGPDDGLDVRAAHRRAFVPGGGGGVFVEDRGHVLGRVALRGAPDEVDRLGGVPVPVSPHAEVEKNMTVSVGDQEAVDGHVEAVEPFDLGLPEEWRAQK